MKRRFSSIILILILNLAFIAVEGQNLTDEQLYKMVSAALEV